MRLPCAIAIAALLCACPQTPTHDGGNPPDDGGSGGGGGGGGAGGGGGTGGGSPRPDAGFDAGFGPVSASDWCAKKALAECQRDIRCYRLAAANLAACVSQAMVACDATAYARGVAEGRLAYDPDAGGRCLDAYGSGSCEKLPLGCSNLFVGKVPPDGGCVLAEDCNSDGFCFMYDGTCPHRCRAYSARGERCDGFFSLCRPPDGCETIDSGVLGCVEKKDAGAPCTNYSGCGQNMVCYNGACAQQLADQVGDACLTATYYPYCDTELFCRQPPPPSGSTTRPPGTCELRAGLGGVCSGYDSCLPSLRCSGVVTTGTCVPKAAQGDPCSQYGDCQDQLFCNPANSRCAALPADGGDCSYGGSRGTCAAGFWCDTSTPSTDWRCRPRQPLGVPCSYDFSCLSNHCEYGVLPDAGPGLVCTASCSVRADGGP